jgi:hypothetical protein
MNITLKRTDEQVELVKAMASKNRDVAYEAQMALADFIGPVLCEVINQAPTLSNLFTSFSFNSFDSPSIPLDLYYDITAPDYVKVYSTSVPGGLPTNTVTPTTAEMKFTTYRLDSAVDFEKRYAAKSRMDVVSKSFTRIAQEIMLRMETTSGNLIMGTLAEAETNGISHVIDADTSTATEGKQLHLEDFNRLLTNAKRINTAWTGGTPENRIKGITDLIMSPEMVHGLRQYAYNPIHTGNSDYPVTDEMRTSIYNNAGIPEFFGISIMETLELGPDQKFTTLYKELKDPDGPSTGTGGLGPTGPSGTTADHVGKVNDIAIGLDRTRESLFRAVALDAENGTEMSLLADDQYSVRQQKIGYYGALEEGRMILDNRVLSGITVRA